MAKSSFPKADPAATAFFHDLVPTAPKVVTRPMFGHTAAFVDGTMFMGVFADRVLVRLGTSDREKLLAEDGAGPFEPMAGRPMREYVLLPADWQDDPDQAKPWVRRSLAYAAALPPKKGKGTARAKGKKVKAPAKARPAARPQRR